MHGEQERNIPAFRSIRIRACTEPGVHGWMEARGKDYCGMNAIELAAFINALKLSGHTGSELMLTHDKGYHPDGSRHPHCRSIGDEKELMDGFVQLLNYMAGGYEVKSEAYFCTFDFLVTSKIPNGIQS